jgi:formate dehydrogenase subunit delta
MSPEPLLRMANQIGAFFETMPDHDEALQDIATHLKKFWEPRMRRALLAHIDAQGNAGLNPLVAEAIARHRALIADEPANRQLP